MGMEGDEFHAASASSIAAAWRSRWLNSRTRRPETLAALSSLGPATVQRALQVREDDLLAEPTD